MFPNKSGGISLYAHEGWRKYTTLVARWPRSATGSAGRSCSRSSARSSATWSPARWFSDQTWTVNDGSVHLGLPHFIAIGVIIVVWAFNIFGIRPFVWLTYVCAACLMVPLFVFIVVPYLTGDWHS